jgi:hypothetical protein
VAAQLNKYVAFEYPSSSIMYLTSLHYTPSLQHPLSLIKRAVILMNYAAFTTVIWFYSGLA